MLTGIVQKIILYVKTRFKQSVDDSMMEQMMNLSTQVKGNCLDLVLTNIPERISDVTEVGRLGRSDVEMITVTV